MTPASATALLTEPEPSPEPLPEPEGEPPTEPLSAIGERLHPSVRPAPALAPIPPPAPTPYDGTRYYFSTGLRAGEPAAVRNGEGDPVLTYRSFASIVGIVAALMTAIVALAGFAAVIFLVAEGRPFAAIVAVVLSIAFAGGIALLVPPLEAALFEAQQPALTITQHSRFSFPSVTYAIAAPPAGTLARVRRNIFSRLGRNRWTLLAPAADAIHGVAIEESFSRAVTRKLLAKFNRSFDANVDLWWEGKHAATIVRRPDANGALDYLELTPYATIDRRLAVALAALVLGAEP
jgi:hypothetical protein